jgi:cell division protein FtsB
LNTEHELRPGGAAGIGLALVLIVAMGYATVAALHGEHGLFSLVRTEAKEGFLRQDLTALQAERAAIANKARRLSAEHLDLEVLDEQARKVLGLGRPDEIIIR